MEKVMLERTIPLPAGLKIQGAFDYVEQNMSQLLYRINIAFQEKE
jgi:hypothetical protein